MWVHLHTDFLKWQQFNWPVQYKPMCCSRINSVFGNSSMWRANYVYSGFSTAQEVVAPNFHVVQQCLLNICWVNVAVKQDFLINNYSMVFKLYTTFFLNLCWRGRQCANVVKAVAQSKAGFWVFCSCFSQCDFKLLGTCIKSHLEMSLNFKVMSENHCRGWSSLQL